ncbi:hypothetical protein VPFG_00101 [Vibrio phage nt-1]|uniref:Uncharacterized protein n=1 Tax=Vibrio phage nt-1 TaxID=115992 RepID=R9TG87_9CAUD|nr:hypothetical protein VPFG_00101 [Vibrio phage nt-1]AGN30103.1 hypothetical protein VPFG_00101 [Vibrio phage nt-1]
MTEQKLYKGVKEKDLPVYTSREFGYKYIYKDYEGGWVPEWARTYVRYEKWLTMRLAVGFYISREANRIIRLMRTGECLARHKGNYVFRYTPVPHTGGRKQWVSANRGKGLMSQIQHDKMCVDEIETEYGKVVRKKRSLTVRRLRDWDGLTHYDAPQRSWKRSKKRKQWMK